MLRNYETLNVIENYKKIIYSDSSSNTVTIIKGFKDTKMTEYNQKIVL